MYPMKFFTSLATCFIALYAWADFADAHVPIIVEGQDQTSIIEVSDPELSQAYYGQLTGFPHTFAITTTEPITLYVRVLLPDIDTSANNISGVIIQEPKGGGRVIEVGVLDAKKASWSAMYEWFGGDTYREGPVLEKQIEPGVYRLQVHTPDNLEKYVLVIGTREEMSIGYFELLRRLVQVKEFFGKAPWRIIESPYIFVPLVVLVVGSVIVCIKLRKRKKGV